MNKLSCFTGLSYNHINIGKGKSLVLCQGYSYSFKRKKLVKRYLYCSKKTRSNCTARINLDERGNIIYANTNHNHAPPNYVRTKEGIYVKLD